MDQEGSWADDLADGNPANGYVIPGNQTVAHYRAEYVDDEWYQMGLTVEGSIATGTSSIPAITSIAI